MLCPECNRVKTTFEPFLTVQLPIPSFVTLQVFYKAGVLDPFIQMQFTLPEGATFSTVKCRIAEIITAEKKVIVHPLELMLVRCNEWAIESLFEAEISIVEMQKKFIIAYHIDPQSLSA